MSEHPGLAGVVSAEPLSVEPLSTESASETLAEAASVAGLPARFGPAVAVATDRALAKAVSLALERPFLEHPELVTAPELVPRRLLTPGLGALRRRRELSPADPGLCRLASALTWWPVATQSSSQLGKLIEASYRMKKQIGRAHV